MVEKGLQKVGLSIRTMQIFCFFLGIEESRYFLLLPYVLVIGKIDHINRDIYQKSNKLIQISYFKAIELFYFNEGLNNLIYLTVN